VDPNITAEHVIRTTSNENLDVLGSRISLAKAEVKLVGEFDSHFRLKDKLDPIRDLYDYVVPYRSRPDVAFFVDAARDAGSPVLEVGCGTGRVLIRTARAGIEIVGLDASAAMLAVCRERLHDEPEAVQTRVQLVQADMRAFDLRRRFTLVTIPFRPFQHLITVEDQLSCLESIRGHLVDGGTLILDLFNPSLDALVDQPIGDEFGDEPEFCMPDGRRVIRRHRLLTHDRPAQSTQVELIYYVTHPDGREERPAAWPQCRWLGAARADRRPVADQGTRDHAGVGYSLGDRPRGGGRQPAVDVADLGPDLGAGAVLVPDKAEVAQE